MKRIITKRLMYRNLITNEISYGAEEYDSYLTNENILGAVYTIGKHEWHPHSLSLYQLNNRGELIYHITIEEFIHYQKSWYNHLSDSIKRILRI